MNQHPFRERVVAPRSFLQIHQALCDAYQIKTPVELSRMVSFLFDLVYDNEHIQPEEDLYNALVPAFYLFVPLLDEAPYRWGGTPAPVEFFPFATPAVDGIDYGFVVHAPELAQEDFPVAEFDPKDDLRGLRLLGEGVSAGVEKLLSRALSTKKNDPGLWEQITHSYNTSPEITINRMHAVAALLGVFPATEKATPSIFDSDGPEVTPKIPKGWRYEPSLDGVGVLAPALFFREYPQEIDTSYECELGPVLSFAERALRESCPASALLVLREALFQNAYLDEQVERLLEPMKRAYLDLNRPLFASWVEDVRGR